MRKACVAGLLTLFVALAARCGSSNNSSSPTANGQAPATGANQTSTTTSGTHFAKTKFVLHVGLAFGAVHRYIYKPFKQGKFSGALLHHKLATVKAALAAALAYHEVKLALHDARSSRILSTLLSPLLALQTKLSSLRDRFTHGGVDHGVIQSANGDTSTISTLSSRLGQPIQDQPTPQLRS